jgi:hypothetical protein
MKKYLTAITIPYFMNDFVISKGNEVALQERAKELEISLCFLYSLKDFESQNVDIKGIILEKPTEKAIKNAQVLSKIVCVKADDNLRTYMERFQGLCFYDIEYNVKKDFIHFRNSGINQVLVALAKKRKHSFVFNFSSFLSVSDKLKAQIFGRYKQNLVLLKKQNVSYQISSFASHPFFLHNSFSSVEKLACSNKIHPLYLIVPSVSSAVMNSLYPNSFDINFVIRSLIDCNEKRLTRKIPFEEVSINKVDEFTFYPEEVKKRFSHLPDSIKESPYGIQMSKGITT